MEGVINRFFYKYINKYRGSTDNTVALEIARREINSEYIFTMHNDCVPCCRGWLKYLKSKLNAHTLLAGFAKDKARLHALHISGILFKKAILDKYKVSFMHNLPHYDVGDELTKVVLEHKKGLFTCRTIEGDKYQEGYPPDGIDRSFDDRGRLIYMHLGRGTLKSLGKYNKNNNKTTKEQWIKMIKNMLQKDCYTDVLAK